MAAAPASSLMLLYSLMLLSSWAFCTNSAKEVQALMEQPTFWNASSSSAGCNIDNPMKPKCSAFVVLKLLLSWLDVYGQ